MIYKELTYYCYHLCYKYNIIIYCCQAINYVICLTAHILNSDTYPNFRN